MTKVVRVGKSSKQARRGPRGPRGPRGYRGFQGPPGVKGETGPAGGLPDGFEARSPNAVVITGTSADTATTVLASGTLLAGKYAFNAQVTLHGGVDTVIFCQAQGPGSAGPLLGAPAALHVGVGLGSVTQATIPLAFAAPLRPTVRVWSVSNLLSSIDWTTTCAAVAPAAKLTSWLLTAV